MTANAVKISEACEVTSSKRIYAKEYIDCGIPFFRGKEVVEKFKGVIDVSTELYISENRFEEIKNKFGAPKRGDLLLTSVGTIGIPYIVDGEFDFYFKDGNLTWFKDLKGIDSYYLYYWLVSPQGKAELSKCQIGVAQPAYTIVRLKNMDIVLPDENIQKKISGILRTYDESIKNNRRRIQLLEESSRLLYKEWFVHLRFPGHEHVKITDGVPEGWESGAVIDFYKTSSGGTPSRKNLDFYNGDINWVKTGELLDSYIFTTEEKITEEAVSQSSAKIFPSGSVLVAMYGATIGRTGILAQPSSSNQACCALIPNHELAHYVHAYLFLMENKAGLINLAKGAAQNNINQDIIKTYPMIMPPKLLMDIFYSSIKESFDQIKNLQQQNTKLTEARDILLPRLMNGDLAV